MAILHHGRLLLVERLDDLKAAVREVTFMMSNGAAPPPDLPGEVLFRRQRARQWQILLRTAAEECLAASARTPAWKMSSRGSPTWKRSSLP